MPLAELQILLKLVQHGSPSGVDAEVLESELEVGNVRLDLHLEDFAGHEGGEEEELLRHGEDEGAEGGDVGLESLPCHGHEVFGEGDAHASHGGVVLALEDARVGAVVRALVIGK